jgi:hypothetical protein
LVATAPVGESAGAVATVEAGGVVEVDDGWLVVVDRPVPPEDGMDVLVVEGPGPVVGADVDVVVVSASSSAGTVVVEVEGSEMVVVVVVVVVVVDSGDGSVVGVTSTVVDVVALPPPGSGSATWAAAGPAGAPTIATYNVVTAIARRTRRCIRSVLLGEGERQRCRPHRARAPFVTVLNVPKR